MKRALLTLLISFICLSGYSQTVQQRDFPIHNEKRELKHERGGKHHDFREKLKHKRKHDLNRPRPRHRLVR
jgi:hypothetical protein